MSEYISTAEAAEILGVKEATLRNNTSKSGAHLGVAPVKNPANGRLMWPREEIERLAAALRKDDEDEYLTTEQVADMFGFVAREVTDYTKKHGAFYGVKPKQRASNGTFIWPRKEVERALNESKLNRLPVSAILPPEAVRLLTNAAKKDRLAADPEDPYRKATHVDKALAIVRLRWPQFFRQPEAKE